MELDTEVGEHLKQIYCTCPHGECCQRDKTRNDNALHCPMDILMKNLTTPPSYTVLRVNTLHESRDIIIQKLQQEIDQQYTEKPNIKPPLVTCHHTLADVVVMKNSGPHTDLEKLKKEVIVGVLCGMSVMRGAHVFAQGIMGAPSDMQIGDEVSVYADLDGSCKKGLTKEFEGRKIYVGNGVAQMSRRELYCGGKEPSGIGILMSRPLYDAPCLSNILPHLVFAQNLPSIVCSHVLDPQPGETILDMCAAPGGKTTHIATLMKDSGTLIALDKAKQKISQIKRNVKRWNLESVRAFAYDGTKACQDGSEFDKGPPFSPGSFDRILLDAPCSALGQRPSFKTTAMTLNALTSYPKYQRTLFTQAVQLLKSGGTLVYSTCTLTLGENEQLVEWALAHFPNILLVKQEPRLGGAGLPGTTLTEEQLTMLQRYDPCRLHPDMTKTVDNDTLGFFIAKFVKR